MIDKYLPNNDEVQGESYDVFEKEKFAILFQKDTLEHFLDLSQMNISINENLITMNFARYLSEKTNFLRKELAKFEKCNLIIFVKKKANKYCK